MTTRIYWSHLQQCNSFVLWKKKYIYIKWSYILKKSIAHSTNTASHTIWLSAWAWVDGYNIAVCPLAACWGVAASGTVTAAGAILTIKIKSYKQPLMRSVYLNCSYSTKWEKPWIHMHKTPTFVLSPPQIGIRKRKRIYCELRNDKTKDVIPIIPMNDQGGFLLITSKQYFADKRW